MASTDQASSSTNQPHPDDKMASDPALVPVTYYPLSTQRVHAKMTQRLAGKPYVHYFRTAPLYIRREALPSIPRPIADPATNVLPLSQVRRLLEPGDHAVENGWYAFPDGTAYVTSKTQFPRCTGEMVDWWFWWHSVEGERYGLWYPYNHWEVRSTYAVATTSAFVPQARTRGAAAAATAAASRGKEKEHEIPILERDDLPHRLRWLGSTHTVSESIGPTHMVIRIEFKEPSYFGLGTWEELREAGYEAAVCGVLWDRALPLKVGDMIHLWRRSGDGLELRSRYYMAHEVSLRVLGVQVSLDGVGGLLGIKRRMAGERLAYEHFLHDQTEFTNLASFLPDIYREFGKKEGQGSASSRRVKVS